MDIDELRSRISLIYSKVYDLEEFSSEYSIIQMLIMRYYDSTKTSIIVKLAEKLHSQNLPKHSLVVWKGILDYSRRFGRKQLELYSLSYIGKIFLNLSDYDKAIDHYNTALETATNSTNLSDVMNCNWNLGIAYSKINDYDKSIEHYKRALEISEKTRDERARMQCLTNLGSTYTKMSKYQESVENTLAALGIAEGLGDFTGMSMCHDNVGKDHENLLDFDKAIEHYCQALDLAQITDDKNLKVSCSTSIGRVFLKRGNYEKAAKYYEIALAESRKTNNHLVQIMCYQGSGYFYYSISDYEKAIEYYNSALEIAEKVCNNEQKIECYVSLGMFYTKLTNYNKAIEYTNLALQISQKDNTIKFRSNTLLGRIYSELSDYDKAIEHYKRALEIAEGLGDNLRRSLASAFIAEILEEKRNLQGAIEHYKRALEIAETTNNFILQTYWHTNLANAYSKTDNNDKAIEHYKRALEIAEDTEDIKIQCLVYHSLGQIFKNLKQYEKAYENLRSAIRLLEFVGETSLGKMHNNIFRSGARTVYSTIIEICLAIGKEQDALMYVEKSKMNDLRDITMMEVIKPRISNEYLENLIKEEKRIKKIIKIRLDNYNDFPAESSFSIQDQISRIKEINYLKLELSLIYQKISTLDPDYVKIINKDSQDALVEQSIQLRYADISIVEYFFTHESLLIFVLSSEGLTVKNVRISWDEIRLYLDNYVDYFYEIDNQENADNWLALSKYLIDPIAELLVKSKTIIFSPDSILRLIPFHALQLHGEPIIRNHSVSYLPFSSYIMLRDRRNTLLERANVFGFLFNEESDLIAKNIFGTVPHKNSSKKVVLSNIDADILHFSCHGYFNFEDPLSSGIILAGETFQAKEGYSFDILTAREFRELKLNASLVVLSACMTGMGEMRSGGNFIGFTNSILYAGAASVIVSTWPANALATKELMVEFYEELKSGKSKALALRRAMIKIMDDKDHPEWKHPYYWAPFILVGDWE